MDTDTRNLPATEQPAERQEFGRFAPGNTISRKGGRPYSEQSVVAQLKKLESVRNARKLAKQIWDRALRGEPFYVELLLNRLHGRVPQITRIAGQMDEDGTERPIPILLLPPSPPADVIDVEASPVDPPTP